MLFDINTIRNMNMSIIVNINITNMICININANININIHMRPASTFPFSFFFFMCAVQLTQSRRLQWEPAASYANFVTSAIIASAQNTRELYEY